MTFQSGVMTTGVGGAEPAEGASRRARDIAIVAPPDRQRAFALARRRSARVRFLRKAILIGGLGSVVAMAAIAVFNPFSARIGSFGFSALSVDGTKITMARPKLSGFRADGQPFSVTAEKALQDIKNPTIVELQKITGEIGMASGGMTNVSADAGVFDSVSEHMQLSDNVRIGNAQFDVRLRKADIDFKTGVYKSDQPVEVHVGEGTTIFGDRASARGNGEELTFEGHVRTRIIPPAGSRADAGDKRTSP